MDKKATNIEREIAELRADSDRILDELERRIRIAIDIRAQAEHHPLVTTLFSLALVTGIGLAMYNVFLRPRLMPERKMQSAAQETGRGSWSKASSSLADLVSNISESVQSGRRRGSWRSKNS